MAHRPTAEELDRPLSRQDVSELRQRLSRLAPSKVIDGIALRGLKTWDSEIQRRNSFLATEANTRPSHTKPI